MVLFHACKKEEVVPDLGSVTVVHAALDVAGIKVNLSGQTPLSWATIASANITNFVSSKHYAVQKGSRPLQVVASADTTKFLFNSLKTFKAGSLNTLFVFGQAPNVETIYNEGESYPTHKDQVIGIRFINLSPNSPALNVTLSTSISINEAAGLAYKQQTSFKMYRAEVLNVPIVFQFREAITNSIIGTYSLPIAPVSAYNTVSIGNARHKNLTLVIKGLVGTTTGANAFGVFPVSHY
jgi:hypothetical protein